MKLVAAAVAALAALGGGCVEWGVVGDGTSVSVGRASDGLLVDGVAVPASGPGFWTPPRWRARGSGWGTDELVTLIADVGRAVAAAAPGARVGVADLSRAGGGLGRFHRSHQSGRDVDLLFFATDLAGRPVELTEMRHFGEDGVTHDGGPPLRFDAARTWLVVRALLTAAGPGVEYLFIFDPLRQQLLDHARAIGEPASLIDWAGARLAQPGDSAPHDDHLHVRIGCPVGDAACRDSGRAQAKKPSQPTAAIARALAAQPIVGSPWLRGPRF
ncbi:MAG: penicillin-insensitive murein endopeptidase [Kofleriaceae bacterium]